MIKEQSETEDLELSSNTFIKGGLAGIAFLSMLSFWIGYSFLSFYFSQYGIPFFELSLEDIVYWTSLDKIFYILMKYRVHVIEYQEGAYFGFYESILIIIASIIYLILLPVCMVDVNRQRVKSIAWDYKIFFFFRVLNRNKINNIFRILKIIYFSLLLLGLFSSFLSGAMLARSAAATQSRVVFPGKKNDSVEYPYVKVYLKNKSEYPNIRKMNIGCYQIFLSNNNTVYFFENPRIKNPKHKEDIRLFSEGDKSVKPSNSLRLFHIPRRNILMMEHIALLKDQEAPKECNKQDQPDENSKKEFPLSQHTSCVSSTYFAPDPFWLAPFHAHYHTTECLSQSKITKPIPATKPPFPAHSSDHGK
ncbi:hypothetical protein ACQZV8_15770 [Magnetococcales bacterium HHB-1]